MRPSLSSRNGKRRRCERRIHLVSYEQAGASRRSSGKPLADCALQRGIRRSRRVIAYGADYAENCRSSAAYVDKIFKGAKPGDLAVQQPVKFEFVINIKSAKALGLGIPPSVLVRVDRVID